MLRLCPGNSARTILLQGTEVAIYSIILNALGHNHRCSLEWNAIWHYHIMVDLAWYWKPSGTTKSNYQYGLSWPVPLWHSGIECHRHCHTTMALLYLMSILVACFLQVSSTAWCPPCVSSINDQWRHATTELSSHFIFSFFDIIWVTNHWSGTEAPRKKEWRGIFRLRWLWWRCRSRTWILLSANTSENGKK